MFNSELGEINKSTIIIGGLVVIGFIAYMAIGAPGNNQGEGDPSQDTATTTGNQATTTESRPPVDVSTLIPEGLSESEREALTPPKQNFDEDTATQEQVEEYRQKVAEYESLLSEVAVDTQTLTLGENCYPEPPIVESTLGESLTVQNNGNQTFRLEGLGQAYTIESGASVTLTAGFERESQGFFGYICRDQNRNATSTGLFWVRPQ